MCVLSSRGPDFFLVGAPKSGTTSLFRYLIQHPSVFVPVKETQFFADYPSARRRSDLDEYLALYEGCPEGSRSGDLSTWHLPSVHAAGKIHALNPAARIAMILRNPIDRAYSHYWYKRRAYRAGVEHEPLRETLSFEEALEAEDRRIREGWGVGFQYVAAGLYSEQVLRYLRTFPTERVRVYLFEDLVQDPDRLCRDFFAFLEIDPDRPIRTEEVFNRSVRYRSRVIDRLVSGPFPGRSLLKRALRRRSRHVKHMLARLNADCPPAMRPGTRAQLVERFRPDIERLEKIVSRDLGHWLSSTA